MQPAEPRPLFSWLRSLLLQALVWGALTIAFAALLKLSGPQSWTNALQFAALNWMPWALLAPGVFWLARRFPLERGHWWRSVPLHVLGCAACVGITLSISTSVGYTSVSASPEDRAAILDKVAADRERVAARLPGRPGTERPMRRPPMWRPMLGATLARANFDAAVYLIVVAAAHAFAFYRRAQEREVHAMALAAGLNRAKLDALRLQLQPHFLFNTLNAISTLVHRDAAAADNLIGDLSDLLRLSLQTTDHEVPLSRELELLDRYLAIEQVRLGDRLRVVRDIDPAAGSALVPTFLLQPIAENAVRHGIEPRLAPGTITLRARTENGLLHLTLSDDGIGLGRSKRAGTGIGITNTEARLRALHDSAARLSIEPRDGGGVNVHVTLPWRTTARVDVASPETASAGAGDAGTRAAAAAADEDALGDNPARGPLGQVS